MIESQKVTSYKLSKQLAELGFDYGQHTGYWLEWEDRESSYYQDLPISGTFPKAVKLIYAAYDCHDLLQYVHWQNKIGTYKQWKQLARDFRSCFTNNFQNALAKAIIEILKEGN